MVSMHASTANHSGQEFPLSAHRTGRAVFPHPALGRVSHHGMHPRPARRLGRDAQHLLESPGQARSSQALANLRLLDSSRHASNQGSFPPRRLCCPPGADGTMSPSDFPRGSTFSMERGTRLAAGDLPCCPVCCADVPHPLPGERIHGPRSGAPMDSSGLPGYSGRSALATSLSRPAQASHMLRPVGLLTHPRWASVPRASTSQLPF